MINPRSNPDGKRIVVATPMMDMCHTAFCTSLVAMVAHTMLQSYGMVLSFLQYGTSILPFSRQLLASRALELGATHILWIDSDMEFEPTLMLDLAKHEVPIVAANCLARRSPHYSTARNEAGEQIFTDADSTGLQQVDKIGFGVMLHETALLRRIEPPWFNFEWIPEKGIYRGEDFAFCEKMKAAGIPIYIDHDVSKQVKHVGTFGFSPIYARSFQDALVPVKSA
jgi:hypothetical protein